MAAARHEAAGKFVNNYDLIVLHNVVHIALEHLMGFERLQHVVLCGDVGGIKQIIQFEHLFAVGHALIGEHGGAGFFVYGIVFGPQLAHHLVHNPVHAHRLVGRAGNDEGRTGFVNKDGVHFVNDGIVVPALYQLVPIKLHVVAQVVKAEFVVGAVGNIRFVLLLALVVVQAVNDDACAQPQETVKLTHPGRVTLGQIVVDRDHMHTLARQGVEYHGQCGDQGFAFACFHFGDLALVQHHATYKLHIIVAHAEHASRCFAHQGEYFGQQGIKALAVFLHGLFVLEDAGGKVFVRQFLHLRLKSIDALYLGAQTAQIPVVLAAEYFFEKKAEHEVSSVGRGANRLCPASATTRRTGAALKT